METVFQAIMDFIDYLTCEMRKSDLILSYEELDYYADRLHIGHFFIGELNVVVVFLLIFPFVAALIMRRIYCKVYLKENFGREYTTIPHFLFSEIMGENSFFTKIDKGTIAYLITLFGIYFSLLVGLSGYLVFKKYVIVSLFMFMLALVIIFFCIRGNLRLMGTLKGYIFTAIQLILCSEIGRMSVLSGFILLICLKYLVSFFTTGVLIVFGTDFSFPNASRDDDNFVERATRKYHEYTGNSVNKYDYASEDAFGHIQLRGEDGEEIEIYEDRAGNYRRVDNDQLID